MLGTRCSMKGAGHCSFGTVLSNNYFRKVLLIDFAITWNNLLEHCISAYFVLMEGYKQGAPRKGLLIDPFVERFKTANLGKS